MICQQEDSPENQAYKNRSNTGICGRFVHPEAEAVFSVASRAHSSTTAVSRPETDFASWLGHVIENGSTRRVQPE
jgi:hypothetical protein